MKWKLIEAPDDDPEAFTAREIEAMSITLNLHGGPIGRAAWEKLQSIFEAAVTASLKSKNE
jgi:hypothetical protein